MPEPRPIDVAKRENMLAKIAEVLGKQCGKLDSIIEDLRKKHVDDPGEAKELLKRAIAMRRQLRAYAD